MTHAFVYKWTHVPTGKWYIGSRTAKDCHTNDGYICSSKIVKPMIIENSNDWVREILATGAPSEMKLYEKKLLRELDAMNHPMSFNETNCAGTMNNSRHLCGRKRIHKNETSKLVKPELLNQYLTDGWKLGQSASHKQKNSEANKGIIRPQHGHGKGGPKLGSTPWNKGRTETRINVLINQSIGHGGNPNNSRNKSIRNVTL